MTADGDSAAEDRSLICLKVLPLLKERQQQHGLRHGDYQRYHGYCSRRLRRLRETLKLPQGDKRHFKKKEVSATEVDGEKGDRRWLEIPVTVTERAWACAMALKQDANTEPRKKFRMLSRLKKAVAYADKLGEIGAESAKVDARTRLEIQAYVAFIHAAYHFEREEWTEAMTAYKRTQAICSQITTALGEDPEAGVYTDKSSEILPAMRYCSYKSGSELKISDLDSEYQSAAIEAMIAQRPKMSEVSFRGHKISVPNEKVAAVLVRIEEFEKKEQDGNRTVDLYDAILLSLRDAIQLVRDTAAKTTTDVVQAPGTKTKPSLLLSYLLFLRLRLTNSRTELMMDEKGAPKDKIRFVEMMLHNFGEMKTIPGLEGEEFEDFGAEIDDQILLFQAVRSRYIGDVYKYNKRWEEALIIYERCGVTMKRALKGIPADSPYVSLAKKQIAFCEAGAIEAKAQAFIQRKLDESGGDEDIFKFSRPEVPLSDRLDEYILDESLSSKTPNVMKVPPPMRPIPCKPLFFDLAGNYVAYPLDRIEERAGIVKKSPKKDGAAGGLTGLVKGLWGWGSK